MKQNIVIESNGVLFTKAETGLYISGKKIRGITIKNFIIITTPRRGFWNKLKFWIVTQLYKDLFLIGEGLGRDAGISIYKEDENKEQRVCPKFM